MRLNSALGYSKSPIPLSISHKFYWLYSIVSASSVLDAWRDIDEANNWRSSDRQWASLQCVEPWELYYCYFQHFRVLIFAGPIFLPLFHSAPSLSMFFVEFRDEVNREETIESWGYLQWRPHDCSTSNFDTVPACDRQADRRTDGFTIAIIQPHSIASYADAL